MFNQYPDLLTVEEACEIMHMSRNTLYELLRNKDIKAFQVNRIWKIPREAVEECSCTVRTQAERRLQLL